MKLLTKTLLPLSAALFMLSGCLKDKVSRTYTILTPVYKNKDQVLSEVKPTTAQPLENPGKIFIYGNYLFVNEINKGVHIIDNSDPSKPVNKSFINIPGNIDIAVKDNSLYADIYTDMLTIDISTPLSAHVTNIARDIFPERSYGNGFVADKSQYIVDWNRRDTTVAYGRPDFCTFCGIVFSEAMLYSSAAATKATIGVAGSMSRFSVVNNYLYTVSMGTMNVFNLDEALKPAFVKSVYMQSGIETIYPFKDKLFIGSVNGMFIYDISNAANPTPVGAVAHMRACDPVVTDGDYAFVTLRADANCGVLTQSRLEVIDVKQVTAPKLLATYDLSNPYGLGKDGNTLWICDGSAGLKVFDASNPLSVKLVKTYSNLEPLDVIPHNGKLIVSAKEGIIQFDYSTGNMIELSRLKKK
ncbi:MAG: hypothetical protein DI535_06225 [Citrobacter freundii]|nr:MAG: hypothetical protein DI535_06225 [Citrobacter freundii]